MQSVDAHMFAQKKPNVVAASLHTKVSNIPDGIKTIRKFLYIFTIHFYLFIYREDSSY